MRYHRFTGNVDFRVVPPVNINLDDLPNDMQGMEIREILAHELNQWEPSYDVEVVHIFDDGRGFVKIEKKQSGRT